MSFTIYNTQIIGIKAKRANLQPKEKRKYLNRLRLTATSVLTKNSCPGTTNHLKIFKYSLSCLTKYAWLVIRSLILDFHVLTFLGKGAYGKVYLVRRKETNDLYALKIVKISEKGGEN